MGVASDEGEQNHDSTGSQLEKTSQTPDRERLFCQDQTNVKTVNGYQANPVEAIRLRKEQQGLTQKDPEPNIGSSGRMSEVLNRKRRLLIPMVKRLHDGLHIPNQSLLASA